MTLIRTSAPPVIMSATGSVLWFIGIRGIPLTQSPQLLFLYFALAVIGVALMVGGNLIYLVVLGGASRNLVTHLMWNEPVSARIIYRNVRARFWGLLGAMLAVGIYVAIAGGVALFAWYLILIIVVLGAVASAQVLPGWVPAVAGLVVFVVASSGALWLFFLLTGRIAYVPQVMMVEGRGVFAAISRSITLARGNVRRLMAMFLFTTFATYSALMLLLIPLGWYGYLKGINPFALNASEWPVWYAIGYQVVTQVSSILLAPVWMLGLSLLYVDERVRHEGYDIELMAAQRLGEMPSLPEGQIAPLAPAIATTDTARAPEGAVGSSDTTEQWPAASVLGLNEKPGKW